MHCNAMQYVNIIKLLKMKKKWIKTYDGGLENKRNDPTVGQLQYKVWIGQ